MRDKAVRDKVVELTQVEHMFKGMPEKERMAMFGRMASRMICAVAKHLIKNSGYSVTTTVLKREFRDIGRSDANEIMRVFKIKEKTPENTSKVLKITALVLGMKLDVVSDETIIRECPHGAQALELKQPLLCNVCAEYCNGIVEGVLGERFKLDRTKSLIDGDGYCMFKLRKKW